MIGLILHPERRRPSPQPRQVDLRKVIFAGLALWCLAALVLVIVGLATDLAVADNLKVCFTGFGLGLLALGWEHNNRRRYRAVAETIDVIDDAPAANTGPGAPDNN